MVDAVSCELLVTHGQVAQFRPDEPLCAELWTGADMARGYIARAGHVDIGVPDHDGTCAVTIAHDAPPARGATGPVPFPVDGGGIILATLCSEYTVPVRPGAYNLHFALAAGDGDPHGMHLNLFLVPV
jgi:hypothetical protein